MALVLQTSATQTTNPNLILIEDITGDYNAGTNPGGWGAPNPVRADVSINNLLVTKPNETSATTIDVLTTYDFMAVNTTLYFTPSAYGGAVVGTAITGATNATPIVITTSTAHGRTTGQQVAVINVLGNLAANGYWTITVLSTTTFSLDGSAGSGAYLSGGLVVYLATATDFIDGVWKFQNNVTADGDAYSVTTYYLHTPLILCCISRYASRVISGGCSNADLKRYTELKTQLERANDAFDCGAYDNAQDIVDHITKLCVDCGCGCGGGC